MSLRGSGTVERRKNQKGSRNEETLNLMLVAGKRDGLEVVNSPACSKVSARRARRPGTGLWIAQEGQSKWRWEVG